MEKTKKSGIPIPKRVAHKEEQPLSPPLSPKKGAVEESYDQVNYLVGQTCLNKHCRSRLGFFHKNDFLSCLNEANTFVIESNLMQGNKLLQD